MKKSIFSKSMICVFFAFIVSIIALNVSMAEEVKKEAPCYANKCYYIIADCPKNCYGGAFDIISFDNNGKSNLDTIFAGCVFLRQKKSENEYNARIDCNKDGKADVIFKLTFLDCEGNICGKCNGSYIRKFNGNVVKSCKLIGYVTYCTGGPQNEL